MVREKGFWKRERVDEALYRLLKKIKALETEDVSVYNLYGRVLAEDIVAGFDVPRFNRAAMDGYAVKAEDTFGASVSNPIMLQLAGSVEIGEVPKVVVESGMAVRIMTGAMMPEGANAVVMLEHTRLNGNFVEVLKSVTPMKNVSRVGEDIAAGEVVFRKGEILQPQDAGVIASLGIESVRVYRKPRVAVITTGNELAEVGEPLEGAKIYNSNNPMICNALLEFGFEAISLGIARDDEEELRNKLQKALEFDAAVITGGTSVGAKDLVPDVVGEFGEIVFHGVSIKPGMPTGAAVVEGKPVFMLPGSPAAALLGFYTFAIPALYRMMNVRIIARKWSRQKGVLQGRIPSEIGVRSNVRVLWEDGKVYPIRISGSGILSSFVRANALLVVPEDKEGYEEGEEVEVTLLRDVTEVFE
ncbi:molybdenum cofactor synthesis domain protein [Archaeoglobus fulgidus DSM 8774]|uniref:molybdopterin molybdotransferase n=1 Tax=Archaeoglobus fulgidus DSM 8774 TaxID=1344584 RepID=A0A075WFB7_ARCFL|nr:gephyrin-like molybdotransferase Glp [Archaeoglobus fulgidus]AIG97804.1 molybdenum cofactor synthesis domain protein [Archaeoglobus fulgidus DSM 8774]